MIKPKKGYIVGVGSRLDNLQTGLDVIGMTEIPVVSQLSDLSSGAISLARGDYVGFGLSMGGLIPGIGQATGALKMARRAEKIMDAASNMKGAAKQTENFLELSGKSKGIKNPHPKAKQAMAKNSEVEAKPAKKEKVKEREDAPEPEKTLEQKINEYYTESPNQLEGKWAETIERIKKENNQVIPKKSQRNNYQKAIEQIERSKQINNPTNGFGKNTFGI